MNAPKPNSYMDGIGWCLKDSSSGKQDCLLVSDWIASIQNGDPKGTAPDKLTTLDELIDGQIGGLGMAKEYVVGTGRAVPIFEFRNLDGVAAPKFQSSTINIESELQQLHQKYQTPPSKRRKTRRGRFIQARSPCLTNSTAPPMPTCSMQNEDPDQGINTQGCICGSTTLPLITVANATDPGQSCSYTALPTTNITNPITITTAAYTTNCMACTVIGGIADAPSCTTMAGCTPTSAAPLTTASPVQTTASPLPLVCKAGWYGTDQTCGGVCNGATPGSSGCTCTQAGHEGYLTSCRCICPS